jgi:serine/threonine protein kinase
MGEVCRARNTRLGREVALKIILAAFASDPDRSAGLNKKGARRPR